MKWLLAFAFACNGMPAKPDKAAFDKLDEGDKCEATVSRGARCADAFLAADIDEVAGSGSEVAKMKHDVLDGMPTTGGDAKALYLSSCLGSRKRAEAVYTCWDQDDCKALVSCVRAHE